MLGQGGRALAVSDQLLDRDDMRKALRTRDFGTVFRLISRHQGASQTEIAASTGLTQGRVSKVMGRSQDRIIHVDVIERIVDGLRIPGHMVGFADRHWEKADDDDTETENWKADPLLRRGVLKVGSTLLAGPVLEALDNEPDAMNMALDSSNVSEERLVRFERAADQLGVDVVRLAPTGVLAPAVGHFRSIRRLVRSGQRTAHRVRLIQACSRFATIVGEVLFIEGRFDRAQDWYSTAYRAALDIGDRYIADIALAGHAYLAIYSDDPRGVLHIVDARLAGRHDATPAIAWLWAFKAKAHAALGERAEAERAFAKSHHALDSSQTDLIRPGIFSFVPEKLALYQANAFVALQDVDGALWAADEALRRYDMRETTEPALVRFERASALVQAGELEEACRYATGTVLDPRTYPCVTVRSRARQFDALLGNIDAPVIREWREILSEVYTPLPDSLSTGRPRTELA
jgi:tetratricopeptide (TPR) repeat protein